MAQDQDLMKLYSQRILALAADMPRTSRLEAPDATARKRAPLCGSTVTVDLKMSDGVVSDYGQDVKACALGQAAASIVGANIVGTSVDDVRAARDALKAMLKQGGPTPPSPFEDLEVLRPALLRDLLHEIASAHHEIPDAHQAQTVRPQLVDQKHLAKTRCSFRAASWDHTGPS